MAPASSREISRSAPRISSIASSELSMFSTSRESSPPLLALDQARHIEPRGVQWLQDVVAGGRQKTRLRDIGVFRGALGLGQLRIQAGQFLGTVAHALFQRGIGAFQRFGGLEARRDVGKGDDQSAAGHPVRSHLDHHVTIRQTFQIGFALGGVGGQTPLQQLLAIAEVGRVDRAHEFEDFPQRNSDLDQVRRQPENFAELPVRTNQLQIGIEHRDTLPHMVQRGLQDLAVEMKRGVGIVEQLERCFGGDSALAQQQRHDQARGRRSDRGGDQMLGVLQQFEIRRLPPDRDRCHGWPRKLRTNDGRDRGRDIAPRCP